MVNMEIEISIVFNFMSNPFLLNIPLLQKTEKIKLRLFEEVIFKSQKMTKNCIEKI